MAIPKITVDIEMLDGTEHENIRVVSADLMRHAEVSRRHKWGSLEEDGMRAQIFLGYAALTRLGHYPKDKGFDEFVEDNAMVMADFGDGAGLDPTQ